LHRECAVVAEYVRDKSLAMLAAPVCPPDHISVFASGIEVFKSIPNVFKDPRPSR